MTETQQPNIELTKRLVHERSNRQEERSRCSCSFEWSVPSDHSFESKYYRPIRRTPAWLRIIFLHRVWYNGGSDWRKCTSCPTIPAGSGTCMTLSSYVQPPSYPYFWTENEDKWRYNGTIPRSFYLDWILGRLPFGQIHRVSQPICYRQKENESQCFIRFHFEKRKEFIIEHGLQHYEFPYRRTDTLVLTARSRGLSSFAEPSPIDWTWKFIQKSLGSIHFDRDCESVKISICSNWKYDGVLSLLLDRFWHFISVASPPDWRGLLEASRYRLLSNMRVPEKNVCRFYMEVDGIWRSVWIQRRTVKGNYNRPLRETASTRQSAENIE